MADITKRNQLTCGHSVIRSSIAIDKAADVYTADRRAEEERVKVLSADKTVIGQGERICGVVTCIVSIVNSGISQYTGLTITDSLGGYVQGGDTIYPLRYVEGTVEYFINGVHQFPPMVTAGPPLVLEGITVPAEGSVILVYMVQNTRERSGTRTELPERLNEAAGLC